MSLDESRMSISSDDYYNRSSGISNTNIPANRGSNTKKCIFGIIILACLILSILIALDVISLRKILGTNTENKINLQVQNQINQEIKEKIKKENKENNLEENENKKPENSNDDKKDKTEEDNKEEKNEDNNGEKKDENKEENKDNNKGDNKDENKEEKKEENKEENKEMKKDENKDENKEEKKDENKDENKEENKDEKNEDNNKDIKKEEKQEENKKENKGLKKTKKKEKKDDKILDELLGEEEKENEIELEKEEEKDEEKEVKEKEKEIKEKEEEKNKPKLKNKKSKKIKQHKKQVIKDNEKEEKDKTDEKESEDDKSNILKNKKKKINEKNKGEISKNNDEKESNKNVHKKNIEEDKEKNEETSLTIESLDIIEEIDKEKKELKEEKKNKEYIISSIDKENITSNNNKENITSTIEKENITSIIEKENITSTIEKENLASSIDKENITSSIDKENITSTIEKENITSSIDKENITSSNNNENQTSSFDKENITSINNNENINSTLEISESTKENRREINQQIDTTSKLNLKKEAHKRSNESNEMLNNIQNISDNGNIGLNPFYKKIDPNDTNYTYIPVVGIDDVHGLFFPKTNKIKVNNETLEYKTGGLEFVTKYINILREDFGPSRVLFFDSGDFYQGGIDSVLFDGEIMQDFYNLVGLNGSTIGNHEFDYSRKWLEKKIKKGNYPFLVNNIKDNSTNKIKGALGKKHDKSHLYNIRLSNGDIIKIGVIGLSFNMKNDKKMPNTWGNRDSWNNLSFYPYINKLEKESKSLRKRGASAVLALAHFGLVCNQTLAMKLDMYNKSSIQGKCFRDDDDSVMFKLTDKLKPGIIDGIIGGDTHMEMHHWENGIPLMSTPTHARYINIMYLPFKKNVEGNYTLVNDEIKIEGPLPACEKIFENYQNCELISAKEYLMESGKLINYSWRGKKIEKDDTIDKIYKKYYKRYKKYAEQDIVSFEGFDKIKVDKSGDCTLCNTYLDAIVDIKKADFAIINRGIFPEELVPGTLTRGEFYNQMPYLDKICTVYVTGKELKDIVETVQSLGKGFYPSSNLKQTIKIDNNGNKTVTNIELYVNGTLTQIEENKNYKMASSLFVLSETSGEDFAKGKAFKIIHKKAINNKVTCSKKTIDIEMANYFKGKGVIDLSKKVDKNKPRIFIEN